MESGENKNENAMTEFSKGYDEGTKDMLEGIIGLIDTAAESILEVAKEIRKKFQDYKDELENKK